MLNVRGMARLGMLAVGWGIGAVVASTPGLAAADSSTDWLSSIDSLLGGVPTPASSTLDFQISIDGYDLLPTAGNEATATSGTGDMAIAYGDGANAWAVGGFGDFAEAGGTDTSATAGITSASNFDSAIDIGNNTTPGAGAIAGNGSDDIAYADGEDTGASAGGVDGNVIESSDLASNNDIAAAIDPTGAGDSFAEAGASSTDPGNSDVAGVFFQDSVGVVVSGFNNVVDVNGEVLSAATTTGSNLLSDLLSLF